MSFLIPSLYKYEFTPVLSGIRLAQYLVFCVVCCTSFHYYNLTPTPPPPPPSKENLERTLPIHHLKSWTARWFELCQPSHIPT